MPFIEFGTPQHGKLTQKKAYLPHLWGNISAQNHRLGPYHFRILACTKNDSCTKVKGHKSKSSSRCIIPPLGNISAQNHRLDPY